MLLGIVTLFPDMFRVVTGYGVIKRAIRNKTLSIKTWNPREFTNNKHRSVDDRPYGGGPGMLMMVDPLKRAINKARYDLGNNSKVIYLSPQGKRLSQKIIRKSAYSNQALILICGRYQGIDERLIALEVDEEWSIGDYILSGGELAAMVCIDAISRILPHTLNNQNSIESDSFFQNNRLACPQYTRPKVFKGIKVPDVLLSGHHQKIYRWRLKQALGRTWMKRPDLLQKSYLTKEEKILLTEFKNEYLFQLNNNIEK